MGDKAQPKKEKKPYRANYADIEEFRRAQSRKLWVAMGLNGIVTLAAVCGVVLIALRPVPVVAFDKEGRALVFENTVHPSLVTDEVRVEHFTREFLDLYVGIDSTRLDQDLRKALNMCTPLTRELLLKEGAQVRRRKKYEKAGVRSRFPELEIRMEDFDPADFGADIHLFAWGRQEFAPLFGDAEPISQWVFVKMVLERSPVRKISPYGMLVRFVEYDTFSERSQMEVEQLKLIRGLE